MSRNQSDEITAEDVASLKSAGYYSMQSIAHATIHSLTQIDGLSASKAAAIRTLAYQSLDMGFSSALSDHTKQNEVNHIRTGSKNVDHLLAGGIEAGSITELFGELRSGKSQFCHTLAVVCQLPEEKGGMQSKVIYIGTAGNFCTQRLVDIGMRFKLQEEDVLQNVSYARAYNAEHLMLLLRDAAELMYHNDYGLLIVDSYSCLFRADYFDVERLGDRQRHLTQMMHLLQRLADEYGIAVVITNHVMPNVDPEANSLSNMMSHAASTMIGLREGSAGSRICHLYKSSRLPEAAAAFAITNAGIDDVIN